MDGWFWIKFPVPFFNSRRIVCHQGVHTYSYLETLPFRNSSFKNISGGEKITTVYWYFSLIITTIHSFDGQKLLIPLTITADEKEWRTFDCSNINNPSLTDHHTTSKVLSLPYYKEDAETRYKNRNGKEKTGRTYPCLVSKKTLPQTTAITALFFRCFPHAQQSPP